MWVQKYLGEDFLEKEDFKELIVRYDLGDASEDEYLEFLSKAQGGNSSIVEIKKEIIDNAVLLEEVFVVAKTLKERGYTIGLLSNGDHHFFEEHIFPERPDFKELFDSMIISSVVHMVKPDPAIYKYALKDIGATPEETIFIDDSLQNIEAAIALGIAGILYTTPEKLIEDLKTCDIHI